jgi:hypothetical protein
MSRREERVRRAIRQFLDEDPPPATAAEVTGFLASVAYSLGISIDRAQELFREEVAARSSGKSNLRW